MRGQGMVHIVRTGPSTRLGRIGASLAAIQDEPTLLQKSTGALIAKLGILALGFCAIVAVAYGVLRDDWIGGALSGITLAIALLPEEFPMVLAIFMALGPARLARHKVLVRRAAVIETLGAATVPVRRQDRHADREPDAWSPRRGGAESVQGLRRPARLSGAAVEPLRTALLASAVRPVDPMDRAVRMLRHAGSRLNRSGPDARCATYPLRPELLAIRPGLAGPLGRRSVCRKRGAGGDLPSLPHGRRRTGRDGCRGRGAGGARPAGAGRGIRPR